MRAKVDRVVSICQARRHVGRRPRLCAAADGGRASAGASYQGLVPGRDRDTAAFALYYGGFSRDLPGQTYELVLEWTYAIAIGRRLTVQPDVQYVIIPGGVSSVGNAVVLGVQLAIEF
jgi:carbohydrate-selective porin OprB